jgi:hypothetical protein
MQKYWLLLASLSLTVSMLSACNSNGESNGDGGEPSKEVETEETQDETSPEDEVVEEETSEKETATEERDTEKTLSYTLDGDTKEETAPLTNSDEQNYSIYKLDGFELTGEEPNKDTLFWEENDALFMRIETISKDDASFEIISENMVQTMAAVSFEGEPKAITDKNKLPQGKGISNPIGMEVTVDLGTVSGIVFEQGNLIVRLTIFDRKSANLTDAFLKMGETIAVK